MDADERRSALNRITETVIGCAFRVADALGAGFNEKVYENSLAHEVRKAGLKVAQQHSVTVTYDGVQVGHYVCDLLVDAAVLIELKAVSQLTNEHVAQCMNYLKATGLKVCLLINFGKPKIEVRRIVNDF
ncbi:MAG: GxxExxY protein [Planctomycetes bacterium]|nr:GxxExxY protein [Planctomycetota bacterium]